MKKIVCALSLSWALLAFAGPANAISFTGTFNITSDAATDPSLVIQTNPTLGTNSAPINFNLTTVNQSIVFNSLFKIGTPESALNISDDFAHKSISVAFSFTAPSPPFGGPVTGETHGGIFFSPFVIGGTVQWDSPIQVAFGVGGLLGIQLTDTTFGLGSNGQPDFEDVKATFTLLALSTQGGNEGATPIPGALPLFASGGSLLGLIAWRRKRKAQAAA